MSRIAATFARLAAEKRKALIPYITAGFPFPDITPELMHAMVDAGSDVIELGAVKRTFGDAAYKLSMSSTKSATGHLLGAAGAIEAIYAIKAILEQAVPPTLNLDDPDEGCDIDLVPKEAKQREVRYALSNSFGFGGTNASLIFGPV